MATAKPAKPDLEKPKLDEPVVEEKDLAALVKDAFELYSHNAFGPLQQADFFAKVAALPSEGEDE